MGGWREERHLTFRITPIGAMCVRLDELPNRQAIGGFAGRDGDVLAHPIVSLLDSFRHGEVMHPRRGDDLANAATSKCDTGYNNRSVRKAPIALSARRAARCGVQAHR